MFLHTTVQWPIALQKQGNILFVSSVYPFCSEEGHFEESSTVEREDLSVINFISNPA